MNSNLTENIRGTTQSHQSICWYDDFIQNKVVYTLSEFILHWKVLVVGYLDLTECMHIGLGMLSELASTIWSDLVDERDHTIDWVKYIIQSTINDMHVEVPFGKTNRL